MQDQKVPPIARLQQLKAALQVDPASFGRWNCLYFAFPKFDRHAPPAELQGQVTALCSHMLGEAQYELLFANPSGFLVVTQHNDYAALRELALKVCQLGLMPDAAAEIDILNLCADHRRIIKRIDQLTSKHIVVPLPEMAGDGMITRLNPEELKAFGQIYHEEKRLRASRSPLRVLLVDDDTLTCRLVAKLLEQDFVVYTAHNAAEAVTSFMLHAPDIVFLDINLPGLSGLQVLDGIAAYDHDAFIVMFSANDNLATTAAALVRGARGFIHKPFQRESFRHYIYGAALAQGKSW